MKRLLGFAMGGIFLAAGAAVAVPPGPGQHFDCSGTTGKTSCATDDTGCVPQTKDVPAGNTSTLKCGDGLAKAFSKAISSVIKCHAKMADSVFKGAPVDDETCETSGGGKSAKEKLDAAIAKIAPLCTGTQLTLAAAEEATLFASKSNPLSLDAQAGAVYCDTSGTNTPIDPAGAGGDDAGTVDTTATPVSAKPKLQCADTVGKELGKLVAAAIKCHIKMADNFFGGKDFDENACEENDPAKGKAALQKYNAAMVKLTSKGKCTQGCLSEPNRLALGPNILAQVEAANALIYPCPTTTTTSTTTTTTTTTTLCPPASCTCTGGTPGKTKFTTGVGAGNCGSIDEDGNPNFAQLKCGGLYFGGSGVAVPLPSKVPDQGSSLANVCCNGTTLTVSGATPVQAGGNRCSGGSNHHNTCTTNGDCPGGVCKFLQCTAAGCLFGPPLPVPNSSHGGAATSTCVVNVLSADASGTASCSAGTTSGLTLPLASQLFLDQDLMPMRCSGGTTPGAGCSNGTQGCGTVAPGSCPGGTCVNDTGRCTAPDPANTICCSDADCTSGTCETGNCVAGTNANHGCITDADCPSSTCRTFIQPCPICNSGSLKCNGGANDGLACTPGDGALDGDFPTSHDCPPPPALLIGALPISFVLDTGAVSKTAVDKTSQVNVFCPFCRNKVTNQSGRRCGGTPAGAACTCAPGIACPACGGSPTCFAVPCVTDADCATVTGFVSCQQRTAGAFDAVNVTRTIHETGSPAGNLTTGGAAKPATLVSIFCIPPSFNALVDGAADLPGPGAVSLPGTTQNLP